ncbi:class GN sortase [Motiliproteus sp. MSK22-1]|uniref:class GN sortase n=1 Tax=Motiliproteus sp. MSK22-1 TaxID=1897630 RepID=UPI000977A9F4|nr:class GN sortase [Motiliproteus sp. MSK22-1]OMH33918.1 sortase, marine proteobacterial type [Motiliproteus sp. MSK22-1]
MLRALILVLIITGVWQLTSGSWIWVKAMLAQRLLEYSWQQLHLSKTPQKPWPWADTYATARLRVPSLEVDQIVLAGDSGRTLAFGPGHNSGSASPGTAGLSIISGHRDTHFRFLQMLEIGHHIQLHTKEGSANYQVSRVEVVDSSQTSIADRSEDPGLLLVTCYPFDSIAGGGPLRYLVWADGVDHLNSKPPNKLL